MPRSWPTVGSSARSTGGPWCRAAATASRRCSPPESSRGSAASRCARPRAASSARARSVASVESARSAAAGSSDPRARPSVRAVVSTSSSTVCATIVELDHCGTHARVRARSAAGSEAGGTASGRSLGGLTRTAVGSVGSRKPARACSTVDLPDPLGPTRAVRLPGAATRGAASTAARRVRAVPSTSRVVRSTTNAEAAREVIPGDSTLLSPGAALSSPDNRSFPARRGATSAGSTLTGSGGPAPGTQMPIARSRSRWVSRVACTGPSATTTPSAESTTSRSTCSTQGPSTCSTTTSVGAAGPPVSAATASRTSRAEDGSSIAVGSSSSTTAGSSASVPARASRWVWPPDNAEVGVSSARSPRPTEASASSTTAAMPARGIPTFSGPKATSRPTEAATTPAPGSWSTRPTAPGRSPGATPSTVTAPLSSPASTVSSSPARARSRVDLPEPDGPTSSTRSPGDRASETSRSTGSRRPNGRQVRPSTSTCPRDVAVTASDSVALPVLLAGRERRQGPGPGQRPHEQPADQPREHRTGDGHRPEVDELVAQHPLGVPAAAVRRAPTARARRPTTPGTSRPRRPTRAAPRARRRASRPRGRTTCSARIANASSAPSPCRMPETSTVAPHSVPGSIETSAATTSQNRAAPGRRTTSPPTTPARNQGPTNSPMSGA